MKNSQKGFVVPLLIVIVAILVIGGGIYYYSKNKSSTQAIAVPTTNTQIIATSSTEQTTNQNLNWQTYSNTNFSIQYPPNWITNNFINTSNRSSVIFESSTSRLDGWTVDVYQKSYKTTATLLANLNTLFPSGVQQSSITIDGVPAKKVDISVPDVHATYIIFEDGNNTYDIVGNADPLFVNFYSSFKFI